MTTTAIYEWMLDQPGISKHMLGVGKVLLEVRDSFVEQQLPFEEFKRWYESLGLTASQVHEMLAVANTIKSMETSNG